MSYSEAKFAEWKAKVDAAVVAKIGLSCDDLPDYPYRDAFEHHHTPRAVAAAAIRAAMEG